MNLEGVLLTGGASRRMGLTKADLLVDAKPLALRLADQIASVCSQVTVLGREAVAGYEFLADADEYAGPLAALARFTPRCPFVFVASCDIPRFDPAVVTALRAQIGDRPALVPSVGGFAQSLCGLYSANCFGVARELANAGERSMRALLAAVGAETMTPEELGIEPRWLASANTPEELAALLIFP